MSTSCSELDEEVLPELMEAISLCDNATMINLRRNVREEPLSAGIKQEQSPRLRRKRQMFSKRASTYRNLDMYETSQISFKYSFTEAK